jgi:hypothetical protein
MISSFAKWIPDALVGQLRQDARAELRVSRHPDGALQESTQICGGSRSRWQNAV